MKRADEIERLKQRLESIGDPRDGHGKRHAFVDILCIALVAMLAGCDDADAFEEFGSVALRRKRCGWDLDYLLSVLVGEPTPD